MFGKVAKALAWQRDMNVARSERLLVAYGRAWAWQRRKAFVMCATRATPTHKRKRGGPLCPWATMFGFTQGAGDELGLQMTQAVGAYL